MGLVLMVVYVALSLLSPADLFPTLAPYRILVIVALLLSICSLLPLLSSAVASKIPQQFLLMTLFTAYVIVSWIPHGWFGGTVFALLTFTPSAIVYFAAVINLRTPRSLEVVRVVMIAITLYMLGMGFMQYGTASSSGRSSAYVLVGSGLDEDDPDVAPPPGGGRLRAIGMLGDPNIYGQYLLMMLPILFVRGESPAAKLGYLVKIPIAAVFMTGVVLTGSRGAALGALFLCELWVYGRFKWRGVIPSLVPLGLVIGGYNIYQSMSHRTIGLSAGMDRLNLWSDGLGMFKRSPLFGVGFGNFMEGSEMTAHNTYLLCAVELGLIGFFLWMFVLVVTFWQLNRVISAPVTSPIAVRWATAIRASLAVYLLTSFFLSCVYQLPLYLLIGIAGALAHIEVERQGKALWPSMPRLAAWTAGLCVACLFLIYGLVRARAV